MWYEYNPEATVLLQDASNQKVKMQYINHAWLMPKSSKRPPYFTDPKYGWNYPII